MNTKNFYTILGVTQNASHEDIKKAYRKLAIQYNPDKNRNDPKAEDKFKEISEAYTTLSSPEKRLNYDLETTYEPSNTHKNHTKTASSNAQKYTASVQFLLWVLAAMGIILCVLDRYAPSDNSSPQRRSTYRPTYYRTHSTYSSMPAARFTPQARLPAPQLRISSGHH